MAAPADVRDALEFVPGAYVEASICTGSRTGRKIQITYKAHSTQGNVLVILSKPHK